MSEYQEGNLRRKAVQRGIVDLRPVPSRKRKALQHDWLVVTWYRDRWTIRHQCGSEDIAQGLRTKDERYLFFQFRYWVVERVVFDAFYKGYRLTDNAMSIARPEMYSDIPQQGVLGASR